MSTNRHMWSDQKNVQLRKIPEGIHLWIDSFESLFSFGNYLNFHCPQTLRSSEFEKSVATVIPGSTVSEQFAARVDLLFGIILIQADRKYLNHKIRFFSDQ